MKNQTGSGFKLIRDDWHIIDEDTVEPCILADECESLFTYSPDVKTVFGRSGPAFLAF